MLLVLTDFLGVNLLSYEFIIVILWNKTQKINYSTTYALTLWLLITKLPIKKNNLSYLLIIDVQQTTFSTEHEIFSKFKYLKKYKKF